MPIYSGNNKINTINIGDNKISKIYKGDVLVFAGNEKDPAGTVYIDSASSGPGTYKFTPKGDCIVDVILVGAGGGGGYSSYAGLFTHGRNGGKGAYCSGKMPIKGGITYTVVVGAGGQGGYGYSGGGSAKSGTGTKGGDTTFANSVAGGGGGGSAFAGYGSVSGTNGAGGVATSGDGLYCLNGAAGNTDPMYLDYGAGGKTSGSNTVNLYGGDGYASIIVVDE